MAEEDSKTPNAPLHRRNSRIALSENIKQFRPEFHSDLKGEEKSENLWKLMAEYIPADKVTIQKSIISHVEHTLARTRFNFDKSSCYRATAFSIRDRLIESWNDTQQLFTAEDHKRVYYLSLEFLLGRLMQSNLVNLNMESRYCEALEELGFKLEELYEEEVDPALGNGGLGRLAACFLDSLATLNYPAWGYGIRYDYGIFRQKIIKGYQVELPDYWLSMQNPWEIERSDITYEVYFGGHVEGRIENGQEKRLWLPNETVVAVAYDTPISGYDTFNTINLRLWRSRPTSEFDFNSFNAGNYFAAVEARQKAEYITSVLYPNDSTDSGKELRLKQQYFFCSATVQDIMRRFLKKGHKCEILPDKIAIQLNDTHPAISIPEMLRILIDVYSLDWKKAWNLVIKIFSYTNHTVLPEALEKWGVDLIGKLLPRHLEIIYLINFYFMQEIGEKYANNPRKFEFMQDMSLIEEVNPKRVRMANLCVLSSHKVNGVAQMHSHLVKNRLFANFNNYFPGRFTNKTNGVTPRRWIHCANRELSDLYTTNLGGYEWLTDMHILRDLDLLVNDEAFLTRWKEIKQSNKEKLARWVKKECDIEIPVDAIYDIMVKRIHEYKRQLMFALYMAYRYLKLKKMSPYDRINVQKRVFMVGGKAAPGYVTAKKVIKLITSIGDVVNNDPEIGSLMKVVFLPNYCVSAAQIIIPGADLSEQISTAGTEASGTGNIKFSMNGALIIGTMDGANVEIAEEIGEQNMFIFGATVTEVDGIRERLNRGDYHIGSELREIFSAIRENRFGSARETVSLVEGLEKHDFYLVCHDFYSYVHEQERVDVVYADSDNWNKMSIKAAISVGKFSSDRAIEEYAMEIWDITKVPIPAPSESALSRVRSQPHLIDASEKKERALRRRKTREATIVKKIDEVELGGTLIDAEDSQEAAFTENYITNSQ